MAVSACVALLVLWYVTASAPSFTATPYGHNLSIQPSYALGWTLPGGESTIVALRTGSTELQDRLSVHISTTIRSFPYYLIFSDHEEDYEGEHIIDALSTVSPEIVAKHADFALYRRLQTNGRASLDLSELSGSDSGIAKPTGNADNPGWKLDKWKFLPMVNETFHRYPHMHWYVFIEADTFIFWSMVQQYLVAAGDHTRPFFAGARTFINNGLFGHGGSGFVISQAAMKLVVEYYATHKGEVEVAVAENWAGDYVLGLVMTNVSVPFTDAWPSLQGHSPGRVPYARDFPRSTWESSVRAEWDNESVQEEKDVATLEDCRAKCEAEASCRQYSFSAGRQCKINEDMTLGPKLGDPRKAITSGWIYPRIEEFARDVLPCSNESWPLSNYPQPINQ
ncbi:hypothetical protein LTR86_010389 [Recurvomyces mirabilis]|nr:hypothetical protein LTR86_010389 [Recurvomyces mirabilis]